MHVHALVDVEEEGDALRGDQLPDVHFLQLADCFDESLILGTFNRDIDIEHLVTLLVCHNCSGVHFFDKADQA